MDPLSRLPVECLEQILRCIAGMDVTKSRPTLFALCRVNRTISRVATLFLYQDPFHLLKDYNKRYDIRGCLARSLLATLLTSIPVAQLHPALRLDMDLVINPDHAPDTDIFSPSLLLSPGCINHVRLLRHFNVGTYTFLEYVDGGMEPKDYSPAELDYIHGQEFLNMYLIDRKDATCLKDSQSKEQLMLYYPNVLYREATWSLAEPILEQLKSLSFLLSDIRRYIQMVDRLGRLERVEVILDMVFDCECCDGIDDNNILQHARRQRKKESFQDLVQFVKEHIKHVPGRLKTVTTPSSGFWDEISQSCPKDVEHEIYALLPLQYVPTEISATNWWKVKAHLETIDLGRIWRIGWLPLSGGVDCQEVLQRCRTLKQFNVQSLPRRSFDWAVQEKKDLERLGHGLASTTTDATITTVVRPTIFRSAVGRKQQDILSDNTPPPPQPAYMIHGLVKLEGVTLQECRMPSRDLDAVAFAFSQSLRILSIDALHAPENVYTIHFGQDWVTMHALFRLELQLAQTHRATYRLELDTLLYTHCPSLKIIRVKDETFEYSCQDVIPCLPANLKLTEMYLRGWSALTFHPTAFQWSKELLVLKLSMPRREGYCFIPPVRELETSYGLGPHAVSETIATRPRWMWDWYLPRLIDISLTSEFAYLFEFRMLHGCPKLETLRLHMRTVDELHTRTISEADLFVLGADGVQERIVASQLRKVYMNGRWIFESMSVLSQFLGQMFPAVERLTARGWGGVSVGSLAEVLRTTAGHVGMVRTDLDCLSVEEGKEVGVVPRSSVRMKKSEKVLANRLFCSGREFIIYKETCVSNKKDV